jgi:hypothetical protein
MDAHCFRTTIFVPSSLFVVPESPLAADAVGELSQFLGSPFFDQSRQVWRVQPSVSGLVGGWALVGKSLLIIVKKRVGGIFEPAEAGNGGRSRIPSGCCS